MIKKFFNELKNNDIFVMYTFLVDPWKGSFETFKKIPRKNHTGDNAICEKVNRTTFVDGLEPIEITQ
jgi:hypothetical protein